MIREYLLRFCAKYGIQRPSSPGMPSKEVVAKAFRLMKEEHQEVDDARTFPELIKELADLAYVVEAAFQAFGVNSRPILAAVHASNMTKDGGKRGDGKILKGPSYVPPDIKKELVMQGWESSYTDCDPVAGRPCAQCIADEGLDENI